MAIVEAAEDAKSILCFSEIDNVGMRDQTRFSLKDFDTKLCTHLVYGKIRLDFERNEVLKQLDGDFLKFITAWKEKNSKLKVLLVLEFNFVKAREEQREIMANVSLVEEMARKVATGIEELNFDGVYFDHISSPDMKNGLMNFIHSVSKAFQPKGFILACFGSNNETIINQGYDIPELSQNVDLLILETYNFHDATNEPKLADHHAPLYKRPWDQENKTVDFLVNLWISKGFPASKILLTIPLWGNSWKLSRNETSPPAPANGKGAPGRLTNLRGRLGYSEICENIQKNNWQVFHYDGKTMGPYAVSTTDTSQNQIWVGYDDPTMAVIKSKYIKTRKLGGAAVKAITYDDIDDSCGGGIYPMLMPIHKTLSLGESTEQWNNLAVPGVIIGFFSVLIIIIVGLIKLGPLVCWKKLTGRGRKTPNNQKKPTSTCFL